MATTNVALAAPNYQYSQPQYAQPYQQNYQQYNQQSYYPAPQVVRGRNGSTLKARIVTVPAGIEFSATTTCPISSEYLTTGQQVSLALGSDFYYNSTLIAPAGSTINGMVVQSRNAKFGTTNGLLKLKFTQIITPYGARVPVSAVVKTADGKGVLLGGTKTDVAKSYAKDIAIGSAVGALAGTILGPISGGKVGRGAALGTAVGAVGGLGKSVIDKGSNVEIPAGATLPLVIDQPITVSPSTPSYSY
jgi:hypothetical protein